MFTSERTVRFREMEYALPVAAVPEAIRDIRTLIADRQWTISFPIEVRATAADDLWLSPSHGRATVTVHLTWVPDLAALRPALALVEEALAPFDARPHWAKVFLLPDAGWLADAYPDLARFRALRERLDPGRHFANELTDRLLG